MQIAIAFVSVVISFHQIKEYWLIAMHCIGNSEWWFLIFKREMIQSYSCHSEFKVSALDLAGGIIWTRWVGWNPGASFTLSDLTTSASEPWPAALSTMLTDGALSCTSCDSAWKFRMITWPADPATTRVSESGQNAIFWIASFGLSE